MIILNENTLEEVFHIHVSRLSLITAISLFSVISFILLSLLILLTPLKNMLPGYGDVSIRTEVIHEALKVDSLENIITSNNRQLNSLKNIIAGNIHIDSINSVPDSVLNTYKGLDLSSGALEDDYLKAILTNEQMSVDQTNEEKIEENRRKIKKRRYKLFIGFALSFFCLAIVVFVVIYVGIKTEETYIINKAYIWIEYGFVNAIDGFDELDDVL